MPTKQMNAGQTESKLENILVILHLTYTLLMHDKNMSEKSSCLGFLTLYVVSTYPTPFCHTQNDDTEYPLVECVSK